jgi:hypothetical protein
MEHYRILGDYPLQRNDLLLCIIIDENSERKKLTTTYSGVHNYVSKGTVQRKLRGVLSGINQQLMISQSVAWYFF